MTVVRNRANPTPPVRRASSSTSIAVPPHVVVLDAQEFTLRALRLVLQGAGFRVSATWSATDALAIVERDRPHAFVVAAPGAVGAALQILASPAVTKAECVRVLLAPPAARLDDAAKRPDIVLSRDDAMLKLSPLLSDAIASKAQPDEATVAAALRQKARRIVAAVTRPGHEDIAHCERVAAWSWKLATELGLTASRALDVELGALLHDIGELHVRDDVLARPGPLATDERAHLQRHPLVGAELLRDIPELHRAIPVVLCHHERADGTGYPRGLTGPAIPFDARIFQVVDTYEALVVGRPWRRAVSHADAVRELRSRLHEQFDPAVFAAFEKLPASELATEDGVDILVEEAA